MRTHIYRFAFAMLFLSVLMSCARNEVPQRRSDSRSTLDHLVIKEVFYIGHAYTQDFPKEYPQPSTQNWYSDDAYITIYNPTSEVKYLDGLALCSTALDRLLYLSSKGTRTSDGSISEWVLSRTSLAAGRSILSSQGKR